ncbi:MAG: F0F1 ATP synthase subunit gamma [Candidatus Omnitrophica bacterium]|nr:F0F1 ATP synthase subunit gamma [Candidatus Omnitrophota bacterium]
MGKAIKVRNDLTDSIALVGLVQTLKDIADNKFYTLMAQKDQFRRFGESFVEFFRLLSFSKVKHPLISKDNPKLGIIVVTVEGSFLAQFNNSIVRLAFREKDKHEQVQFIGVGDKCAEPLGKHTPNLKIFPSMEKAGLYETAVAIKDYIIPEVMSGRLGKIMICHAWPKSFDTQKFRATWLLPCEEIVVQRSQFVDEFSNIIQESEPVSMIEFLVNLWITSQIFDILVDTTIASAAAQSSFLEDRVSEMNKNVIKVRMNYRKARKGDIDKSLRETFTARMMTMKE